MRPRIASTILVAALAAAGVGLVPGTAHASAESTLVSLINQERASRGISRLSVRSDLTSAARRQADAMADAGSIFHSSNLGGAVSGWTMIGENVGTGTSVDQVHDAFMDSSGHRANILERHFNEVGVGVVEKGGSLWIAELFVERRSSSSDDDEPRTVRRTSHSSTYHAPAPSTPTEKPAPRKPKRKKIVAPARTVSVLLRLLEIDRAS